MNNIIDTFKGQKTMNDCLQQRIASEVPYLEQKRIKEAMQKMMAEKSELFEEMRNIGLIYEPYEVKRKNA